MRLLLYNIRYGAGIGKRLHFPVPFAGYLKHTNGNLDRIAEFIRSVRPDITGLIEVDSGSFRSEKRNQADTIAGRMSHCYIYQSKYHTDSVAQKVPILNKQGNALLTHLEIKAQKFHYLSEGIKRLVIELELRDLTIFLVHLSLKYRHRQSQLKELYALIQQVKKPVIVAGDFNAFRGDRELSRLMNEANLKSANNNGRPSHPSRYPRRQLDFILHSPELQATRFEVPQVKYSDHVPLICDFEIRTPTGRSPVRTVH